MSSPADSTSCRSSNSSNLATTSTTSSKEQTEGSSSSSISSSKKRPATEDFNQVSNKRFKQGDSDHSVSTPPDSSVPQDSIHNLASSDDDEDSEPLSAIAKRRASQEKRTEANHPAASRANSASSKHTSTGSSSGSRRSSVKEPNGSSQTGGASPKGTSPESEILALKAALEASQAKNVELEKGLQTAQKKSRSLEQALEAERAKAEKTEKARQEWKDKATTRRFEITALEETKTTNAATITRIRKDRDRLSDEAQKNAGKVQDLTDRVKDWQKVVDRRDASIQRLQSPQLYQDMNHAIATLEADIQTKNSEISRLREMEQNILNQYALRELCSQQDENKKLQSKIKLMETQHETDMSNVSNLLRKKQARAVEAVEQSRARDARGFGERVRKRDVYILELRESFEIARPGEKAPSPRSGWAWTVSQTAVAAFEKQKVTDASKEAESKAE